MKLANSCGVNGGCFTNNPSRVLAKMVAQMGDDFEGRYRVRIAKANDPKTKNMKAFLAACNTLNAEYVGYETEVTTIDIAEVKPVHYLLIKPTSEESLKFHLRVFSGFMNLLALEEFNDEERKTLFVTLLALDMPKVSKPDPQRTISLLTQGHHRFTALLILAHLGIIPREWLRAIPVYQADVTTSQLIALAKRKSRSFNEQSLIEWDDLYEAA